MRRWRRPGFWRRGFRLGSGQIIDASIVAAPKQRNTDGERHDIKEGRIPPQWAKKPAKLRQKDRDARWTVKYTKAKPSEDGALRVDLAIPAFGYKNHIGIDRRHGLIRRWTVTYAARHDGALLPELIDRNNTAGDVWADTAYRSKAYLITYYPQPSSHGTKEERMAVSAG